MKKSTYIPVKVRVYGNLYIPGKYYFMLSLAKKIYRDHMEEAKKKAEKIIMEEVCREPGYSYLRYQTKEAKMVQKRAYNQSNAS